MRKQRELAIPAMLPLLTTAASGQNIPEIRDSLQPLELPNELGPAKPILYAAAILIVIILIWLMRSARHRHNSVECPEARAQRRLSAIQQTEPRAFYAELHKIFVEYIEGRVLIKASRCTTPELLDILTNANLMSPDWRSSLQGFLADCDRAKFSPALPNREPAAAITECRALINQIAAAPLLAMGVGRRRSELL